MIGMIGTGARGNERKKKIEKGDTQLEATASRPGLKSSS